MNIFNRIFLFIVVALFSCANKQDEKVAKKQINPEAIRLNDSAMKSFQSFEPDYEGAIELLNQAIVIDSNYFRAYYNKVTFYTVLKQYDKALESAKDLVRIQPENAYHYGTMGVIYERIGDSISAHKYFQTSKAKFEILIDTLSPTHKGYSAARISQAINLIMLNEQVKANEILKDLYKKENDEFFKEYIASLMNKNKKEILEFFEKQTIEE